MYREDSFFSLSIGGQIGLACLSLALAVVVLVGGWRLMRGRALEWRLLIAVALFALFVWLSPQVYYTYYRMIFEDLPAQWVIGWPPFGEMWAYASFTGRANLSAHSQGALWWGLVALALTRSRRRGLSR